MSAHTPGPWQVYLDTQVTTAPKHHGMHGLLHTRIVDCNRTSQWSGNGPRDEDMANARLIAAAPDLLNALQQVLQAAPEIAINLLPGVQDDWDQLTGVVRAALAKGGV
jgi:hypothetical protein